MEEAKTLLQQLIRQRGWTYPGALAALEDEARKRKVVLKLGLRQFSRWVAGDVMKRPQASAVMIVEATFERSIEDLLGPPETLTTDVTVPTAGWAGPGRSPQRAQVTTESDWVAVTAHEAGEHATDHGSHSIPPMTIEQFRDDVIRLARIYAETPPLDVHVEAVRIRDRVYTQIERTRRPAQAADLYLIAGQLCGIIASAAFGLGYRDATVENCRAAYTYGDLLDHNGLRAWARGIHAQVAWRAGQASAALDLIRSARQFAEPGTSALRLHCLEARAWSYLGAPVEAIRAVEASEVERERANGTDEFYDQVGGEFAFGPARQAMSNGSALLQVRQAAQAIEKAELVIDLSVEDGLPDTDLVLVAARADLALARLMQRQLDGALDAIRPVFHVAPTYRRRNLIERLITIRTLLSREPWRSTPAAIELARTIEDFASDDAGRGLPAVMGRALG